MNIKLEGYSFSGPYQLGISANNQSGVYVILKKNINDEYCIIDVGESKDINERLFNHDRENCWKTYSSKLYFCTFYCEEFQRKQIEELIRQRYDPPCGKK